MQMRRFIIITLVLIVAITTSSCNVKSVFGVDVKVGTPKPVQTEVQNKPEDKQVEKLIEGKMDLAYEGKIDNLQSGVGDSLEKVIAELGEPLELAYFEGSSYISYENISFMLNKTIDKISDEAAISGIIISEGYELYGVKVGMTPSEIKSILGAANQEYKDGEDGEEMWKIEYKCGDYSLIFFFNDSTSPSTSAYLSKLQL